MIKLNETDKTVTYQATVRKGYLGDFGQEWWTDKDWEAYKKSVKEMKADGTYGKESEVTITFVKNPLWDEPKVNLNQTAQSHKFIFLDNGKYV